MEKVLVTGSTGQLGSELKALSKKYPQFEWVFADRNQVSMDDPSNLSHQLNKHEPVIIVNCAAYTAVDNAETEQELSDTVNHKAVGLMAEWTAANKCRLIHISTDYVFDGTSSTALDEEAVTSPINIYGATKLDGEKLCSANNPNSIIIRTSWVYSSYGNNFVKTMMRLMKERDSLNVVNDQVGSPTYAADLALAIMSIINHKSWHPGIYNYSNTGAISWCDFANDIKEIGDYACDISGIPSSAYPTPAKRPAYSLLDKTKIASTFGVVIPYYKESLERCMKLLQG